MKHFNDWRAIAQRGRTACAVLLLSLPVCLALPAAAAQSVGPGYDIEMSRMIPMRDGITLETWITKPSHLQSRIPTVLTLTQYDIDGGRHGDSAAYYARRG